MGMPLVIALYWSTSLSTVFINKLLLNSSVVNFNAPMFVTWYQYVVASLLCFTLTTVSTYFPSMFENSNVFNFYWETAKQVMPYSLISLGVPTFSNLCLKYAGVSYYTIARSLSTVFTVIISYVLLNQVTTWNRLLCCVIIVIGFYLGTVEDTTSGTLPAKGATFCVLSALSLSLSAILVKHALLLVDGHILVLSYYYYVWYSVFLIPFIIINGEFPNIANYNGIWNLKFWGLMSLGALLTFLNGYVGTLQIKMTSPLTHNVSVVGKSCTQALLGTVVFQECKTRLWWFSNFLVMGATIAYALQK